MWITPFGIPLDAGRTLVEQSRTGHASHPLPEPKAYPPTPSPRPKPREHAIRWVAVLDGELHIATPTRTLVLGRRELAELVERLEEAG